MEISILLRRMTHAPTPFNGAEILPKRGRPFKRWQRTLQGIPDLVISLGDRRLVEPPKPRLRPGAPGRSGHSLGDDAGKPRLPRYRRGPDGQSEIIYAPEGKKAASAGWEERGIDLSTRAIDAGRFQLILMDSALSSVPDGTEDWLQTTLAKSERNLLFTHVPINLPVVKEYILQVDPRRD